MNFSQITDFLFIGTTPLPKDYALLRELSVGLVINMRVERRPYPDPDSQPLPVLWLPAFDSPLVPISMRTLQRGVSAALEVIHKGEKVYIHCAAGVHRSVALGVATLIAMEYSLEDALQLVKQKRKVADPHAWYILRRIEHFARTWQQHKSSQLNFYDLL
jgi:protein-tyrosine phosphatase